MENQALGLRELAGTPIGVRQVCEDQTLRVLGESLFELFDFLLDVVVRGHAVSTPWGGSSMFRTTEAGEVGQI